MAGNKGSRMGPWANMDQDILVRIFVTLNLLDLISISRVCSSWHDACSNPIIWNKLDLTMLKFNFFNIRRNSSTWSDDLSSQRLTGILKSSLCLSCGNLSCLVFHFSVFINDDHLIYAAERTPSLKRLVLPTWNPITAAGFEKAIKNWEGLESLVIPCVDFPYKILKLIGKYCKNFFALKVMCSFDIGCARAIAAYTPKLKVLSLQCTKVYKEALVLTLSRMEHLEVLNISHSLVVEDSEFPGYSIVCDELDNSIIEPASRLKNFIVCQRESCDTCRDRIIDDEEMFRWYRFEEPIWRVDEVSTLAF